MFVEIANLATKSSSRDDGLVAKLAISTIKIQTKIIFPTFFHRIEAHLDIIVHFLNIKISVYFQIGPGDNFIEFRVTDLVFQSPHPKGFLIFTTFLYWKSPVDVYESGIILGLVCFHLIWLWNVKLIHDISHPFEKMFKFSISFVLFLVSSFIFVIS